MARPTAHASSAHRGRPGSAQHLDEKLGCSAAPEGRVHLQLAHENPRCGPSGVKVAPEQQRSSAAVTGTGATLAEHPTGPQRDSVVLGTDRENVLSLFAMDRTLTYTVADLASDEGLALRCDCRVRTYGRSELAALVGRDARLHLLGLRRELWCPACGEPPFYGWVVAAVPSR
jgi:hypothetical protein